MSALSGKRILLVEDEALIAAMVEDMLAELGAVVVGSACHLDAALSLARSSPCDAAVLDVNLRGATVFPVADALRARTVLIVFATGYGEEGLAQYGRAPVIEKPYTREKLQGALVQALSAADGLSQR